MTKFGCGLFLMLILGTHAASQSMPANNPHDATSSRLVKLGKTGITLECPASWTQQQAASTMIEHEFAAGNATDGNVRVTVMAAGGSIDANIDRWRKQFVSDDGQPVRNQATEPKRQVAERTVHIVDFSGTYLERMQGPLSPAEEKSGYRMLAAILELGNGANYFIKLYGPAAAVAKEQTAFDAFLASVRSKP